MIETRSVEVWFTWRVFGLSIDAADPKAICITLPFVFVRWFR